MSERVSSLTEALRLEDDEARAGALAGICRSWQDVMRQFHAKWFTQIKFREGEHYGVFDTRTGTWRGQTYARREIRESRLTLNYTRALINRIRAIMTRERPAFSGFAMSQQVEDVAASKMVRALVEHLWRAYDLEDLYGDVIEDAATCGTWAIDVFWDETLGAPVEDRESIADARIGEDGTIDLEYDVRPEGALRFLSRGPFELVHEPGAGPYEGQGVFTQFDMSRSELVELFGEDALEDLGGASTADDTGAHYDSRLPYIGSHRETSGSDEESGVEKHRVYRLFVRRTREYPRGKMLFFVENKILYEGDNPMCLTEEEQAAGEFEPRLPWPIFVFRWYHRPKSWAGDGVVADLMDPQRKLNGAGSKAMSLTHYHGNPRMLAPVGSGLDLSNDHRRVIEYQLRHGPESVKYLQPPQFPEGVLRLYNEAWDEMERLAGINAATMGRGNAEDSGRKIQLQQQQDLGQLAPIKARCDRMMANVMAYAVRLIRRHSSADRLIQMTGEDGQMTAIAFQASKLAGSVDVGIKNNTSLPQDPAARHVSLSNMLGTIAQLPPEMQGLAFELYSLQDYRRIERSQFAGRDLQREETLELYSGATPRVEFFHDHLQHMEEMRVEMESARWIERCRAESPEDYRQSGLYQRFLAHFQEHMQHHQQLTAAAQQPPGGAPPAMGDAPPEDAVTAPQPSITSGEMG